MATDQELVDLVLDRFAPDCVVTARRMFGEHGAYGDGVFIGLIRDDRFFKRKEAGAELLGADPEMAPPCPGAKPTFVMNDEQVEDPDFPSAMARVTTRELAH